MNAITVLGSGFGLGFYIPALLLRRQLRARGMKAEVCIFESLLQAEKQSKIDDSRKAYHASFKLALMSSRLPKDMRDSLDMERVQLLLQQWEREGRTDFIVLSGHWLYVLEAYRLQAVHDHLNIDKLYVDAALSPSWNSALKFLPGWAQCGREIWMYDRAANRINWQVPVTAADPVPYEQRYDRYVIHGGGWGMGMYTGKIPELEANGFQLDIVAYEAGETDLSKPGRRVFMNDPEWKAWVVAAGKDYGFPPFGEIMHGCRPEYRSKEDHHRLHDVIRKAKAVISKPGGSTLIDVLASATPLIMLEPFGEHEAYNLRLWTALGLGITYEAWKQSAYSGEVLEAIHNRLLRARAEAPLYAEEVAARYLEGRRIG